MSNFIKNCRLQVGSWFNKFVVDQTDEEDVLSLITSLHPIEPGRELIRVGDQGDGGYLIPDDLEGIQHCFSPGVAESAGFELGCAEKGMDVFMADHSVDRPPFLNERFYFTKKFIGVTTNSSYMTLDQWVSEKTEKVQSDLILQIDIEGFEYEVFLAASDELMKRFRIIIVEFHRLDHLWAKPFYKLASRAIEKILQTHHCVHAHPNNWRGTVRKGSIEIPINMEFTFFRKDRVQKLTYAKEFPHQLDSDNVPSKPSVILPSCWYGGAGDVP